MKRIATHNGTFHGDDTFAVAIIKMAFGEVEVIRTRDETKINIADFVLDVGGKYDNEKFFDHHQSDRAGSRENGFPYASAGLVWRKFGVKICDSQEIANKVDMDLIRFIDSADCGFGVKLNIQTMSDLISSINPRWNENPDFDSAFSKAVDIATLILERNIAKAKSNLLAKNEIETALANREKAEILILERFLPWHETVLEKAPEVLYVVFPSTGDNIQWNVRCVPVSRENFESKKALPISWAGKNGADLAAETNISDAIFCHIELFIAGAVSKTSAIKMAELALL